MRRLGLLLVLLLTLALPARAEELPLQALLDRTAPLVEAELGATFAKRPAIRTATREELAAVLATEFLPQLKMQLPKASEEEIRDAATSMAGTYSEMLIGKYDAAADAIYVVPENVEALGGMQEDLLRAMVIHELVHALDEQEVHAVSGIAELASGGELEVWNALVEGHAQYVTRRVLVAGGEEPLFAAFEDYITRLPPDLGEGERYLLGLRTHFIRFAYVDGRRFFEALPREHHREVFVQPPTSKSQILHPEQYGQDAPTAPVLDVTAHWDEIEAARPAGWVGGRRAGDESLLRAAFGEMLEASRTEPVLARVRASHFLQSRAPDASAVAAYAIYETESPEAAADLLALQEALSRAKDEKMKTGMIRVLGATYTPVAVPGASSAFLVVKKVEAAGTPLTVRSVIGTAGSFVLEVLYSGAVPGDPAADLERMVRFVCPPT